MKQDIPDSLRKQMAKAGKARIAKLSKQERFDLAQKAGLASWAKRLAKAQGRE